MADHAAATAGRLSRARLNNMQAREMQSHDKQRLAVTDRSSEMAGQPSGRRSPRRPSTAPPNQPPLQSIDFKSRAAGANMATPAAATTTPPSTRRPRFQCTPPILCGSVPPVQSIGAALAVPAASREVRSLNYSWLMPSPMEDDPELESQM